MRPFVRRAVIVALLVLAVAAFALPAFAQATPTSTPTPDPSALITFPPPVYTVRGQFPIFGTAAIEGQTNYFIEFRALDGGSASTGAAQPIFFPVTLPATTAVVNGQLGAWDTSLLPDGLYELRLTVSVEGGAAITHVVNPLRVENRLDPVIAALIGVGAPTPEPVVVVPVEPTVEAPTAAPTEDPTPRVTVGGTNANVRSGDSVVYPIVGSLSAGQTAPIVGISALGTGWYQVRLPNGTLGWMSPTVVTVSGDLGNTPRVQPPPPPPTATPTPLPVTAVPTAAPSAVNLVAGDVRITPFPPTCGQPYNISFDVANLGSVVSAAGTVRITDARAADGQLPQIADVAFPAINPGQTIAVTATITTFVFFDEVHRITLSIDPGLLIPETNEGDNIRTVDYTLVRGTCG